MASDASRDQYFPGSVTAFTALASAVRQDKRPETLLRLVEIHLLALGNQSGAALLAAGAQAMARNDTAFTSSYISGISQDLRKVGAYKPANYLKRLEAQVKNAKTNPKIAVLDASALALRHGATPQPDLAKILSYDIQEVTFAPTRNLVIQLLRTIAPKFTNSSYRTIAEKIETNATTQGATFIREKIVASRQQATKQSERN